MTRRSCLAAFMLCCLSGLPPIPSSSAQTISWQAAWPMVGHDPQRTNRSPATASMHPILLFSHPGVSERPVVGFDGVVYAWTDGGLAAISASGQTLWTYRAWPAEGGPPVLAPDGILYANGLTASEISVPNAAVLGVGPGGRLAVTLRPSGFSKGSPPVETATGTLYVPYVGPTERYAGLVFMPAGKRVKLLQPGFTFGSMAVGPNGSIYAMGRYSSHESGGSIERLTPAGRVQWRHALNFDGGNVMVGAHGHIYVTSAIAAGTGSPPSTQISAYTTRGRLEWRHRPTLGDTVLAQRSDGVIVAAGQLGTVAYSATGVRLWRASAGSSSLDAVPSIAVDAAGTTFVSAGDGMVRILSNAGILAGTIESGPATTTGAPQIAIGGDGRLIITGADGVLRVYG